MQREQNANRAVINYFYTVSERNLPDSKCISVDIPWNKALRLICLACCPT